MIPIAYPLLGAEEQEAGLRVLSSGQLAQGEHVAAFDSSILTIEERDRILERKAKCARPGYRYRA